MKLPPRQRYAGHVPCLPAYLLSPAPWDRSQLRCHPSATGVIWMGGGGGGRFTKEGIGGWRQALWLYSIQKVM